MKSKTWLCICALAMVGQVATAQNNTGNILTGEAKVDVIRRYNGPAVLPKPEKIVIQDFALTGDIITDDSIAARIHKRSLLHRRSSEDSAGETLTQQVQGSFTKTLIGEFTKVNKPSERMVDDGAPVHGTVLLVEGEFVSINEGDKTKRIIIGFGRGASDIKTHVTVSSVTNGQRTVIMEFTLNSASGKKPGAVVGVSSIAVSAAAEDVGDRKSTPQGDASRMAKAVAKQIEGFMIDQKWIAAPAH